MVDFRPRLMTVPQAAKYAAESRATLYKEWKKGNIEFLKMGGSTRIETSELDRYIDTKAKPAAQ
ncbi:MAG: helix-turn-helix domain-containing protein [Paracoccaceae bacterium]